MYFHLICSSIPTVTGSDGFVYSSVPVGDHTIIVRGTAQDGQTSELTISLSVSSQFMITAVASVLGSTITVIIDANQDATFECQLDASSFVPCKLLTRGSILIPSISTFIFPFILCI